MKYLLQSKKDKDKSTEIFPPLLLKPIYKYMRTCNAEGPKRSAKGSNFKEDDRAEPLSVLFLNQLTTLRNNVTKE